MYRRISSSCLRDELHRRAHQRVGNASEEEFALEKHPDFNLEGAGKEKQQERPSVLEATVHEDGQLQTDVLRAF